MKRILMIGAGDYQVPAIKRIRELGHEVYCVDYKENQPGFQYADGYRIIDVRDKEACLEYARELNVNGVLTWGATLTLPTVSYICDTLGLPCMPMSTSEISKNKFQIRQRLTECGLNSAGDCVELYSPDDVLTKELKLPFVVKPSDGSGSKGVHIVKTYDEIEGAVKDAFAGARNNHVYVEPFIQGDEFSVEAYSCDGEVYVNIIVKTEFDWVGEIPLYKQTAYLGLDEKMCKSIEQEVINAVKALDVNWGPVNFDLIVSELDGKPYIIDVGIRNGQNLLASHIIPYSRGVDELNSSIALCLGEKVDVSPKFKKYISSRLLIYPPGIIKEIKDFQRIIGLNNIIDIVLRKEVGDQLSSYHTKSDICGWVLCEGETPEEASSYADMAWEMLKDYIIIK